MVRRIMGLRDMLTRQRLQNLKSTGSSQSPENMQPPVSLVNLFTVC
jgi:hypothetical protein